MARVTGRRVGRLDVGTGELFYFVVVDVLVREEESRHDAHSALELLMHRQLSIEHIFVRVSVEHHPLGELVVLATVLMVLQEHLGGNRDTANSRVSLDSELDDGVAGLLEVGPVSAAHHDLLLPLHLQSHLLRDQHRDLLLHPSVLSRVELLHDQSHVQPSLLLQYTQSLAGHFARLDHHPLELPLVRLSQVLIVALGRRPLEHRLLLVRRPTNGPLAALARHLDVHHLHVNGPHVPTHAPHQVEPGRDLVSRVVGVHEFVSKDFLVAFHESLELVRLVQIHLHDGFHAGQVRDLLLVVLEDDRPGIAGVGVVVPPLALLLGLHDVLVPRHLPDLGEVRNIVRRVKPLIPQVGTHVLHLYVLVPWHLLEHHEGILSQRGLSLTLLGLLDIHNEPLTVVSASVVVLHPEGPGLAIISQPVGEDDPHEVRQVLVIGDEVIVELVVEHLQSRLGDHQLPLLRLVVVPVVRGGDAPRVGRESHLVASDLVVLEDPQHLGVVVPGLVTQQQVLQLPVLLHRLEQHGAVSTGQSQVEQLLDGIHLGLLEQSLDIEFRAGHHGLQTELVRSALLHPVILEELNEFLDLAISIDEEQVAHSELHRVVLVVAHQHAVRLELQQPDLLQVRLLETGVLVFGRDVHVVLGIHVFCPLPDVLLHVLVKLEHLLDVLLVVLLVLSHQVRVEVLDLVARHETLQEPRPPDGQPQVTRLRGLHVQLVPAGALQLVLVPGLGTQHFFLLQHWRVLVHEHETVPFLHQTSLVEFHDVRVFQVTVFHVLHRMHELFGQLHRGDQVQINARVFLDHLLRELIEPLLLCRGEHCKDPAACSCGRKTGDRHGQNDQMDELHYSIFILYISCRKTVSPANSPSPRSTSANTARCLTALQSVTKNTRDSTCSKSSYQKKKRRSSIPRRPRSSGETSAEKSKKNTWCLPVDSRNWSVPLYGNRS